MHGQFDLTSNIIQPYFDPYPCDRRVFVEESAAYCLDARVGDPCIHPSECRRCPWRLKPPITRLNRDVPKSGAFPCVPVLEHITPTHITKSPQACIHGRDEIKSVTNDLCPKCNRTKLKVFQCKSHGEVTVVPCKSGETEYFNCKDCDDFKRRTPPLPAGVTQCDLQRTLVVIPVVGKHELTKALVDDIRREIPVIGLTKGPNVCIVDNGDDLPAEFFIYPYCKFVQVEKPGSNLGWLNANNMAVSKYLNRFDRFVLLNNDLRLSAGFFAALIDAEKRFGLSIVTASYDGYWQSQCPAGLGIKQTMSADLYQPTDEVIPYGACDGTCVSMRREVFERVGVLDADHFGRYGWAAMTDLCFRAKAVGMTTGVARGAYAHHVDGGKQTANEVVGRHYVQEATEEGEKGMEAKYGVDWRESRSVPCNEPVTAYTTLVGDRDTLKTPAFIPPGWRFVCFSDNPMLSADGWEIRPLAWQHPSDPRRTARWHKTHSEQLFPDESVTIWADASIRAVKDWREMLWYLGSRDLAVYRHYERHDCYQEAAEVVRMGLDDAAIVQAQMQRYRDARWADKSGLAETGIVIRRHSAKVAEFNRQWWAEIDGGSKRDQLSFPFVACMSGVKVGYIQDVMRKSRWLKLAPQKERSTR